MTDRVEYSLDKRIPEALSIETELGKAKCVVLYSVYKRNRSAEFAELINQNLLGKLDVAENYYEAAAVIAKEISDEYDLQ